jgi:hypothetical protein
MMINAPGFAPAWEIAKSQAVAQLEAEEKGNSFPQRMFRKLVGSGSQVALPADAAHAATSKNGASVDTAM